MKEGAGAPTLDLRERGAPALDSLAREEGEGGQQPDPVGAECRAGIWSGLEWCAVGQRCSGAWERRGRAEAGVVRAEQSR
jgi:hypothetical protein